MLILCAVKMSTYFRLWIYLHFQKLTLHVTNLTVQSPLRPDLIQSLGSSSYFSFDKLKLDFRQVIWAFFNFHGEPKLDM